MENLQANDSYSLTPLTVTPVSEPEDALVQNSLAPASPTKAPSVDAVNGALGTLTSLTTTAKTTVVAAVNEVNTGVAANTVTLNKLRGTNNVYSGNNSLIFGGSNNTINNKDSAFIASGIGNLIEGNYSAIFSGIYNKVYSICSVAGGQSSTVNGDTSVAFGYRLQANGFRSAALGGDTNIVNGDYSVITGGSYNTVNAAYSAIIGSSSCTVAAGCNYTILIGCSSLNVTTGSNQIYINNVLYVAGGGGGGGSDPDALSAPADGNGVRRVAPVVGFLNEIRLSTDNGNYTGDYRISALDAVNFDDPNGQTRLTYDLTGGTLGGAWTINNPTYSSFVAQDPNAIVRRDYLDGIFAQRQYVKLGNPAYYTSEFDSTLRAYQSIADMLAALDAEIVENYGDSGEPSNTTLYLTRMNPTHTISTSPPTYINRMVGDTVDTTTLSVNLSASNVDLNVAFTNRLNFFGAGRLVIDCGVRTQARYENGAVANFAIRSYNALGYTPTITLNNFNITGTLTKIGTGGNGVTIILKGTSVITPAIPFGVVVDDQRPLTFAATQANMLPNSTTKVPLVSAVNSLTGYLASLPTVNKNSLVDGISEVYTKADKFVGDWNPKTNSPELVAAGTGVTKGSYYRVSVDGGTAKVITGNGSYNVPYDTYVGFPSASLVQIGSVMTTTATLADPYFIQPNTYVVAQNSANELIVYPAVNIPANTPLVFTYTPPSFAGIVDFRAGDFLYWNATAWALRPGIERVISGVPVGTPSVAQRTGRYIEFNLNAVYAPITTGTFTVDTSNKVVGARVVVYQTPGTSDPTTFMNNSQFQTKSTYVSGKNLEYVFTVGGNGYIQYVINVLD